MPTVNSLGISGLPLDSLLTSLQNDENRALQAIQARQTANQAKVSAYGKLQGTVSAFQVAAEALKKVDSFGAISAKSASDSISATAAPDTIPGQYSIEVNALATQQSMVYNGRADRMAAIGAAGTLDITTADGKTHSLDLSDTSLNGLVKAINTNPDIGVNATIVNDGDASSPYRLLLTSRDTGTQAAITEIKVTGNDDLQAFLGTTVNADSSSTNANVEVHAAQDAALTVNGIAITSHTNTVTNVIDGVTLTLNKTTSSPANLALTRDDSSAKKAIMDFVSSYNNLQSTIQSLTAYDVGSQSSSALTGDSVARSVQTRLQGVLMGAVDSSSGLNLSSIGISLDMVNPRSGQLVVDQTVLDKALANNGASVKALFTGSTGVGAQITTAVDAFTRPGGIFSTASDGLTKTMADIDKQIASTKDIINQRMNTYRTQFTQLDAMATQMKSVSDYLTQQMTVLNGSKNK
ncbi:MAG TPA: flagellar filament capping protein FliD [Castellaniella sp.]|uniref:flagellar filament capping protein FliD n=1 Tax=Castellaniella sp. TaxID=1955812 RepID=UPI002F027584